MSLLDRDNGVLILDLPISLEKDAIYEIYQFIPSQKILNREFGRHGLKIFFSEYDPVRKVLAKRRLTIKGVDYPIRLLVTPLTIHNINSLINESKLRKLIEAWEIGSWLLYPETRPVNDQLKPTGNYRVVLLISDAENVEFPKFLRDPDINMRFEVTLYCRRCMENGHRQYQCEKNVNIPTLGETSTNKHEAQRDISSRGGHTSGVDGTNLLYTKMKQKQEWDEVCNINSSSQNNVTYRDDPCYWTGAQSGQDWVSIRAKNDRPDVKEPTVSSFPTISRNENNGVQQTISTSVERLSSNIPKTQLDTLHNMKEGKDEDTSFAFNSSGNSIEPFSRHSFKTEYNHFNEHYDISFSNSSLREVVVHDEQSFYSLDQNKDYVPKQHAELTINSPPQAIETKPLNRIDHYDERDEYFPPRDAEEYNIRTITSNYTNNCSMKSNKHESNASSNNIILTSHSNQNSDRNRKRHSSSFATGSSSSCRHDCSTSQLTNSLSYVSLASSETNKSSRRASCDFQNSERRQFHDPPTNSSKIDNTFTNQKSDHQRKTNNQRALRFTDSSKSCMEEYSTFQSTESLPNASITLSETNIRSHRKSRDSQNSNRDHSNNHHTNPFKIESTYIKPESNPKSECNNVQVFCCSSCLNFKSSRSSKQESSSSSTEMSLSNAHTYATSTANQNIFQNLCASIEHEDISELNTRESQSDSDSNFENEMSQKCDEVKAEDKTSSENKLNLTALLPPSLKNKVKEIKNVIRKVMAIDKETAPELSDIEVAAVKAIINNKRNVRLVPHQRRFIENLELCLKKLNGLEKIIKAEDHFIGNSTKNDNSSHNSSDDSVPGLGNLNRASKQSKPNKSSTIVSNSQHSVHNRISKKPIERIRKSSETVFAVRRHSTQSSFDNTIPDTSNAGDRLSRKSQCHKIEQLNTHSNSHRRNLNKSTSDRTLPHRRNSSPLKKKTAKYKRSISQPATCKSEPFSKLKYKPSTINKDSDTEHLPTSSGILVGEASSPFFLKGKSSASSNSALSSTYVEEEDLPSTSAYSKEELPSTSTYLKKGLPSAYDIKFQTVKKNAPKKFSSSQTFIKGVSTDQRFQSKNCYKQNKIPKQLNFKYKTKSPVVLKSTGFSKKWTPGLWAANNKTSSIMDKFKFQLFSTHVRRKKHLGPMVYKYADNFDQVKSKIEAVLEYYYNKKRIGRDDNSEVRILKDLIGRLDVHMKCDICLRSKNIT
ncbi:putative uncharacterized protein DDB_G0282133 [Parasteatoda tepidariorum]|uniref:putative uncharacterized protein DDB_G0282133 n=1 Tax=Parasteatoda tepidariorum TaxID=114398 RepID=UPI001C71E340|nr:putative uncharacterized protein DDB_G0282133 [Parasteatoda tepidariorum]